MSKFSSLVGENLRRIPFFYYLVLRPVSVNENLDLRLQHAGKGPRRKSFVWNLDDFQLSLHTCRNQESLYSVEGVFDSLLMGDSVFDGAAVQHGYPATQFGSYRLPYPISNVSSPMPTSTTSRSPVSPVLGPTQPVHAVTERTTGKRSLPVTSGDDEVKRQKS